jgi:ribose-phosphate pyrophosphokinase
MGLDLGKIKIKRFADGEIYVQLQESVRGCDVFLVQPTCPPANENLMELLVMIDACRRASAKTITAVIPYFGYARADRKVRSVCQLRLFWQIFVYVYHNLDLKMTISKSLDQS